MATSTINIYRVLHTDEKVSFEYSTHDGRTAVNCPSLGSLARTVRDQAEHAVDALVNVNFEPMHEMQICAGLTPRRFVPLSDEEVDEFWKTYIAE